MEAIIYGNTYWATNSKREALELSEEFVISLLVEYVKEYYKDHKETAREYFTENYDRAKRNRPFEYQLCDSTLDWLEWLRANYDIDLSPAFERMYDSDVPDVPITDYYYSLWIEKTIKEMED